jgi:hypothetical protein
MILESTEAHGHQIVEDPTPPEVREARRAIHHKDAPILAAARQAEVGFLVMWNTRHFQHDSVRRFVQFPLLTLGEFLHEFRRLFPTEL